MLLNNPGPHEHNELQFRRCKTLKNLDIPHKLQVSNLSTKNISPQRNFIFSSLPSPKILSWTWQEGEDDDFQIFGVTSLGAIAGSKRPSWSDGKGILGSQPSTSFRVSWQTDCLGDSYPWERDGIQYIIVCVFFCPESFTCVVYLFEICLPFLY